MLAKMEESSSDCDKCLSCAYRDTEINYCWYTVTTNRKNYLDGNICEHYVNVNAAMNKWK